jgi:hypothetical protein
MESFDPRPLFFAGGKRLPVRVLQDAWCEAGEARQLPSDFGNACALDKSTDIHAFMLHGLA